LASPSAGLAPLHCPFALHVCFSPAAAPSAGVAAPSPEAAPPPQPASMPPIATTAKVLLKFMFLVLLIETAHSRNPMRSTKASENLSMKSIHFFLLILLTSSCNCSTTSNSEDAGISNDAAIRDADANNADAADAAIDPARALPPRPDDFAIIEPELPPCPQDMVRVRKSFCIDKYEASLVDAQSNQPLSPYYQPLRKTALSIQDYWEKERLNVGPPEARELKLPTLSPWQKSHEYEPKALSVFKAVPQGYLTGPLAALSCKNAGKRLCSHDEWRTACRGEADRAFPYGDKYEGGKCNIFREAHPAAVLHGNASIGHSDPRLNRVESNNKPLLRLTGTTRSCASEWEGDSIYDMVGNMDEWIDDPEGTFVGGFYARSKKDGCDSVVKAHPFDYFDYSTGVRCCKDLK
jgi:formylglycine-generating enzyme